MFVYYFDLVGSVWVHHHNHSASSKMENTTVESIFVNEELKITLTIKLGEPLSDVRAVHKQPHNVSLRSSEGYAVLLAKVESIVSSQQEICWMVKELYLKPGTNTKQREFVRLSADNFDSQVVKSWRNAQRRGSSTETFRLLVFVYAAKVRTTYHDCSAVCFLIGRPLALQVQSGIRRATAARISEATTRIQEHFVDTQQSELPPESLALRYFATQHAREPDGTTPSVPDHATYRQLTQVDEARRQMAIEQQSEQRRLDRRFRCVRVMLNDTEVKIEVSLDDLREILGLPECDLRRPHNSDIPLNMPSQNMEDEDHQ
jgi:hypothetical protein